MKPLHVLQTQFFSFLKTIFLLGFTFALATGCASSQIKTPSHEILPFAGSFKVHRYDLKNGLRVLVLEDHSSPTFAYQTWFRVGSRNEVPGKTGLAHFFEHMMFKETKNLKDGEFDRLLEKAGVQGENAFTSRDYTAYIEELPKDKLSLVARLEADRMQNLVIDEKGFNTEKEVVQNERRFRNENNPDGLLYQEIYEVAFKHHPYHWPVIGYEQDLAKMKASEGLDFYRSFYAPNHATLVVVGDVDPEEVYSTVTKFYGNIPAGAEFKSLAPIEPPQKSPRLKQLKLNIQVEKAVVAYRIPGISHEDIPALQVMQSILTGGKSSRLYRALVDSGVATAADSFDPDSKDPGLLIFWISLQKGKKAAAAESILLRECARLASERVSSQELERAKNKLSFDFYDGLTSSFQKALFMGTYEVLASDFQVGLRIREKIQTVTPADIQRVAKTYLKNNARTVLTGVPK